MKAKIIEIITNATKEHADPVEWVLDYLHDKDSHISRAQAQEMVTAYMPEAKAACMPEVQWTPEAILMREG